MQIHDICVAAAAPPDAPTAAEGTAKELTYLARVSSVCCGKLTPADKARLRAVVRRREFIRLMNAVVLANSATVSVLPRINAISAWKVTVHAAYACSTLPCPSVGQRGLTQEVLTIVGHTSVLTGWLQVILEIWFEYRPARASGVSPVSWWELVELLFCAACECSGSATARCRNLFELTLSTSLPPVWAGHS